MYFKSNLPSSSALLTNVLWIKNMTRKEKTVWCILMLYINSSSFNHHRSLQQTEIYVTTQAWKRLVRGHHNVDCNLFFPLYVSPICFQYVYIFLYCQTELYIYEPGIFFTIFNVTSQYYLSFAIYFNKSFITEIQIYIFLLYRFKLY